MFPEVEHPTEGRMRHLRVPVKRAKIPGGLRRRAEHLGASSAAVLAELGYSEPEIERLAEDGVTRR